MDIQRSRSQPVLPRVGRAVAPLVGLALLAGIAATAGCADDSVGRSTTTTKKTVETPTEKTTITETKKKETTIDPRN